MGIPCDLQSFGLESNRSLKTLTILQTWHRYQLHWLRLQLPSFFQVHIQLMMVVEEGPQLLALKLLKFEKKIYVLHYNLIYYVSKYIK